MTEETNNQNRRQFVQSAASMTATATIANATAIGHVHGQETSPNKDEVTIGIVGAGGRGTGAINDSLSINENVKVVSVADLTKKKGERLRQLLETKHAGKVSIADSDIHSGLDGYQKLLADPKVDVVIFATPPGFRPRHIAEAIEAGKHVFAEKPSCVDPAGYHVCLEAQAEAERKGLAIVTGTQYRRQTNYVGVIEQIRKGMIGDVINATSRYCSNGIWFKNRKEGMTEAEYQIDNWMHFVWLSGDQIVEQAVHNIDAMNWVMDSVPEVAYGSGGRFTRPEGSEMWDSMSIDYIYPGNKTVSFMCRQIPGTTGDNHNVVYGSEGIAHIGALSKGSKILDREGNEIWSQEGKISDAYKQEHKDLIDSIRAGKPIVELRQTSESSLTAVMGRLAAYTGKKVDWDFMVNKSKLNLFPANLSMDSELPESQHAVPGTVKLV